MMVSGEAERYDAFIHNDAFIRNDSGVSRNYPATVLANSTFTIEVCMQVDSSICGVCVCVCVCVCPGQNPSYTSSWCPGVTVASLLPANMTWLVE